MRRNACETELRHGTRCEIVDLAEPSPRDLVVFMVFPKECHEHIDVEQERHAVCVSTSLTSWEVMTPFAGRITGKPSSPVAIVKRCASCSTGTTTKTLVCSGRSTVSDNLIWPFSTVPS